MRRRSMVGIVRDAPTGNLDSDDVFVRSEALLSMTTPREVLRASREAERKEHDHDRVLPGREHDQQVCMTGGVHVVDCHLHDSVRFGPVGKNKIVRLRWSDENLTNKTLWTSAAPRMALRNWRSDSVLPVSGTLIMFCLSK